MSEDNDEVQEFLQRIDEYLENKDLGSPKYMDEFREIENMTMDEIRDLTSDECFNHALGLLSYLDHLVIQKAKQDNVVRYCDFHIRKIVAKEFHEVQNVYGPYELKEDIIIREHEVASKLSHFRNVAECRSNSLKSREFNIRKKVDILNEKGKRI